MVAFSGWFRTMLIWGALSRGLLEPLERMPLRFGFSRFKGDSWVGMLRQSGLHIRWRDMSRSTESIRQIVHHPYVQAHPSLEQELSLQYQGINAELHTLMENIHSVGVSAPHTPEAAKNLPASHPVWRQPGAFCPIALWDRPAPPGDEDLGTIVSIEAGYANFCTTLMTTVLLPYWDKKRTGLVEASDAPVEAMGDANHREKQGAPAPAEPLDQSSASESAFIQIAEELIVVRYVSLIRAVLVNMRYLMLFVSAAFVLAIIAWNSYPFQPQRLIDWSFTLLLLLTGIGFIWVFAQMHRNPILSRITDTRPNELGYDFYIRIISFGAIPVLTWLAYQFPEIGGSLFKFIKPGLQVMK
jgi:hypothetical protein